MAALTLVYVNTSGRPFNFYGTVYEPGELIVGMEDEANVSAVVSQGAVHPVVLESLPSDAQDAHVAALEAYRAPKAPKAPEAPAAPEEAPAASGEEQEMSKEELYEMAQELDIPGRTKMSKEELAEAVAAATAS